MSTLAIDSQCHPLASKHTNSQHYEEIIIRCCVGWQSGMLTLDTALCRVENIQQQPIYKLSKYPRYRRQGSEGGGGVLLTDLCQSLIEGCVLEVWVASHE